MMKEQTTRAVIIGGAPKCGTTSLYHYLAAHPDVKTAWMKETRYFLPERFKGRRALPPGAEIQQYLELFSSGGERQRVLLEASTEYIFSSEAAQRIKSQLPHAHVVFVLRDPIERLASWLAHQQQDGYREARVRPDEYVKSALAADPEPPETPAGPGLEGGLYMKWLRPYLDLLGESRVHVVFLDALEREPESAMRDLCRILGLDPEHYRGFEFPVHNPRRTSRFPKMERAYKRLRVVVQSRLSSYPRLRRIALMAKRTLLDPLYRAFNVKTGKLEPFSHEILEILENYYRPSVRELAEWVDIPSRWRSTYLQEIAGQ